MRVHIGHYEDTLVCKQGGTSYFLGVRTFVTAPKIIGSGFNCKMRQTNEFTAQTLTTERGIRITWAY